MPFYDHRHGILANIWHLVPFGEVKVIESRVAYRLQCLRENGTNP